MRRQRLNVFRMRLLGAKVVGVSAGSRTLKDAISEAMRDWVTNVSTTHYLLGSALGAHPYPMMVRDFHRVIGDEARVQSLEQIGRLPDLLFACVGGGSNAIGLFYPFLGDPAVRHGRRGSGRAQPDSRRTCSALAGRIAGRSAWRLQLSAAGRGGPDQSDPFDFRRARLRAHRSRTCLASRPEAGGIRFGERCGCTGGGSICWREPKASSRRSNRPTP